jgi:hypothetical protein
MIVKLFFVIFELTLINTSKHFDYLLPFWELPSGVKV